jgi:uracil-DNA glycosylase family 4
LTVKGSDPESDPIVLAYDPSCRRCPRLAHFLDQVKADHPDYFCKPVPPFGDPAARLLIVGLAPGLHGANATGRPFTGDWCGPLLYSSLHRFGFASRPASLSADDGLKLLDCRITNAVKCLPPQNKPEPAEIRRCAGFLACELSASSQVRAILTLGTIAHQSVLLALGLKRAEYPFAHHRQHALPGGIILMNSYHVSRYNTQTGRLTEAMFHAVLKEVRALLP